MACQNISEQIRWGRKVLQINLWHAQDCALVCLFGGMVFSDRQFQRSTRLLHQYQLFIEDTIRCKMMCVTGVSGR